MFGSLEKIQEVIKLFKLKEKNAKITTEIIAGLTTFFTMAYIVFVNPDLISAGAGGDEAVKTSVFVATCLAAFFGTLLMGLLANIPFAQAPGMGLNAFFAFTVMGAMGYSYAQALAIVFISGILFILITAVGLRQAIVRAIPKNLRYAISVGIGLFIAFIGLQGSKIVVNNDSTLVGIAPFKEILNGDVAVYGALMTILGVVIIAVLNRFKVPGAILVGIIGTSALYWLIGSLTGIDPLPAKSIDLAQIGSQFGTWADTSFGVAFTEGFAGLFKGMSFLEGLVAVGVIVLSFSFVDMFDTIGTLIGAANKGGMLDEDGNMPEMTKAMLADSIATTTGAVLGTSTVTTFVESSAGIAAGGRTGLSSVVTAVCFLLALALAPLTGYVPGAATNAAIIFVGVLMMSSVKDIEWDDATEAVPAFVCIAAMPFCYSISEGIFLGIITHVLIKVLSFKFKDVSVIECILAALFILKYLFV
ncbi:MAG: NCS2 family permease [Ruminococcaceae bacterium]|nr:NCS2 family permease [Oscillospiraceae bacterium]